MSNEDDDEYVMGADDAAKVWVDPELADCPVIPLGYYGAKVVFALPEGELREEPASKISGMLKTDIFVSVPGQVFLSAWNDPEDGKFKAQTAAIWFNRQCRAAGKWDTARPQRGYGLWPGDEGPILHVGGALGRGVGGRKPEWTPIAQALRETGGTGPVWLLQPPHPRPDKAAGRDVAETLRKHLKKWKFRELEPGGLTGADVVLGWHGQALLGACTPFRAHVMVIGGRGAGKTTLSRLMQAAGSANAGDLLDSFSEAGLKNSLSGEARAVYLDEAEPSPDGNGPVERAMEILRRMATGDGSRRAQGDTGGRVNSMTAVGAAWLGSILPVPLGEAMATRVVEVRLNPLGKAKGGADDDLKAAIAWARDASGAMLARAIRDFDRFRSDVSRLKAALGEMGQDPRGADLVAVLAAGRRLMLFDQPLDEETAAEEARAWAALITVRTESSNLVNPGQACLQRLFSVNSGKHEKDRHLTISEVIQRCLAPDDPAGFGPDKAHFGDVLKAHGLRLENNPRTAERPGPWLLVSNNHDALRRAFAGSHYGDWRGALGYLEDLGPEYAAQTLPKPVRFGMHQSRALAVPLTPWLEGPVAVGVDRAAPTPFDAPEWRRDGQASHDSYRAASHDGGVDA